MFKQPKTRHQRPYGWENGDTKAEDKNKCNNIEHQPFRLAEPPSPPSKFASLPYDSKVSFNWIPARSNNNTEMQQTSEDALEDLRQSSEDGLDEEDEVDDEDADGDEEDDDEEDDDEEEEENKSASANKNHHHHHHHHHFHHHHVHGSRRPPRQMMEITKSNRFVENFFFFFMVICKISLQRLNHHTQDFPLG